MSRRDRKEDSRRRILEAARALFKAHGYAGVSVAEVMRAAGLTHGAFYAHFPSKQALHAAALEGEGFAEALRQAVLASDDPLGTLIDGYLSEAHLADRENGCVIAAIAGEAVMGQGEARGVVGRALPGLTRALERLGLPTETAGALVSVLVGGLVLARAAPAPEQARGLLADARRAARRVVGRDG